MKIKSGSRMEKRRTSDLVLLFLFWCRHQESNSGPADYKSAALPVELRQQTIPQSHFARFRGTFVYAIAQGMSSSNASTANFFFFRESFHSENAPLSKAGWNILRRTKAVNQKRSRMNVFLFLGKLTSRIIGV